MNETPKEGTWRDPDDYPMVIFASRSFTEWRDRYGKVHVEKHKVERKVVEKE